MAKNYNDYSYFENRPDVVRIFNDLEAYLDYCRITLQPFNPADLYRKESATYQAYLNSKRPRRQWVDRGDRNNGERGHNRKPYGQNFSR
jgi:hypothetical protein